MIPVLTTHFTAEYADYVMLSEILFKKKHF